jgi:hypothetical protein
MPIVAALTNALRQKRDDIYRLLLRVLAPDDVEAARQALESGDARARATAAEYLDNVLPRAIRRHAVPVLELPFDAAIESGERRGDPPPKREEIVRVLGELAQDRDLELASMASDALKQLKVA